MEQWRLAVERARYEAERAERRYRAVEPENRLVARGLETDWERCLSELERARSELERRERRRPRGLTTDERKAVLATRHGLAAGLGRFPPRRRATGRSCVARCSRK